LGYLSLAFSGRPQFRRLLKIQHCRPGLGCAEPRCGGPFEEAHYTTLREKSGNGFLSEVTPEGQTGIMTPKIDF
jgi:hypothetical protein